MWWVQAFLQTRAGTQPKNSYNYHKASVPEKQHKL